jgi:hypothetical protein
MSSLVADISISVLILSWRLLYNLTLCKFKTVFWGVISINAFFTVSWIYCSTLSRLMASDSLTHIKKINSLSQKLSKRYCRQLWPSVENYMSTATSSSSWPPASHRGARCESDSSACGVCGGLSGTQLHIKNNNTNLMIHTVGGMNPESG